MEAPLLSAESSLAKLASVRNILKLSAPAIINNAAAPIAAALQLGLLGHSSASESESTHRTAVFSAVGAITTFVAAISNFVIVVTMARVSHAIGMARDFAALGRMVRAVLAAAVAVGGTSALVLWLGRGVLLGALSLANDLDAVSYLPLALGRLPPLLLLKAASAVLVGYQRVRAASVLNLALAAAETLGFYLVVRMYGGDLVLLGALLVVTCAVAASTAVGTVLAFPPHSSVRVVCCWPSAECAERAEEGCAEGAPECAECATRTAERRASSSLLSLACDSFNVLVRSVFLSGSVLAMMLAVAPLGDAAVQAHAVVLQLWMVTSYVVDGFADVGTMLGGRFLGAGEPALMRALSLRLLGLGLTTGMLAAGVLGVARAPLVDAFAHADATGTRTHLLHTPLWALLCALQPVNALVFVYDGLLYAARAFRFVRDGLVLGVALVFAPGLAAAKLSAPHSLLAVWAAKAGLNGWRCLTALAYVHLYCWPRWAPTATSRAPTGASTIRADTDAANSPPAPVGVSPGTSVPEPQPLNATCIPACGCGSPARDE